MGIYCRHQHCLNYYIKLLSTLTCSWEYYDAVVCAYACVSVCRLDETETSVILSVHKVTGQGHRVMRSSQVSSCM